MRLVHELSKRNVSTRAQRPISVSASRILFPFLTELVNTDTISVRNRISYVAKHIMKRHGAGREKD